MMKLKQIEIFMNRLSVDEMRSQFHAFFQLYFSQRRSKVPLQMKAMLAKICAVFHHKFKTVVEDEKKAEKQDDEEDNALYGNQMNLKEVDLEQKEREQAGVERERRIFSYFKSAMLFYELMGSKDGVVGVELRYIHYLFELENVDTARRKQDQMRALKEKRPFYSLVCQRAHEILEYHRNQDKLPNHLKIQNRAFIGEAHFWFAKSLYHEQEIEEHKNLSLITEHLREAQKVFQECYHRDYYKNAQCKLFVDCIFQMQQHLKIVELNVNMADMVYTKIQSIINNYT